MKSDRRPDDAPASPGFISLPDEPAQEVVVVTGLSGGGKTAAAKLFEDLGYVVVDNLPGELLRDLADLVATDPVRFRRTAIVLDVRAGDVPLAFGAMRGALEGRGIRPVSYADWLKIETAETELGTALGRGARVKLASRGEIYRTCGLERPRS